MLGWFIALIQVKCDKYLHGMEVWMTYICVMCELNSLVLDNLWICLNSSEMW